MIKFYLRISLILTFCLLFYRWMRRSSRPTYKSDFQSEPPSRADPNKHRARASRIFISHSWRLSARDYNKFLANLRSVKFIYNHSIPRKKARWVTHPEELYTIFRKQMLWCSKVFVLADKDLSLDSYVVAELNIAAELGKEIIAIQPNPYHAVPRFISRRAHRIIGNEVQELRRLLA